MATPPAADSGAPGLTGSADRVRNVAIIAHVDHGKTTLVDGLLYNSGMFRTEELDRLAGGQHGLILDSGDLERERGITILSKNCALRHRRENGDEYRINIVDTPGHADFGGEVERVLSMADGALLVVDSFEGPMPQTRFVLKKAIEAGLRPIVVINKIDRSDARPEEVVDEVFDLFVDLDADDETLDFPILYGSGRDGWASTEWPAPEPRPTNLRAVVDAIIEHVPAPPVNPELPLQVLVTSIQYSEYVGRIAIGRVSSGRITKGQPVAVIDRETGDVSKQKVVDVQQFDGLGKSSVDAVEAGDIVAIVGLNPIDIGDTIADVANPVALPPPPIDEPTLSMQFQINDGPFAGQEGEFVTSRQIRARLDRELESDVALRIQPGLHADEFKVSGRGLMHLGILLETMRREGYEICAARPRVVDKEIDGVVCEPIERLVCECPSEVHSAVMGLVGERRGEMLDMRPLGGSEGYMHMEFTIPARGLIGLRGRILTATQGRAIMHHTFEDYAPSRGRMPSRQLGVMISGTTGPVTAYSLDGLFDRGVFFVEPGEKVYEGQIVGEHCKDSDIVVNVTRQKKLTNVRASGKDDSTSVKPPRVLSLEAALEYIQDGELVEITPDAIRLRKRLLSETDRKREARRGG